MYVQNYVNNSNLKSGYITYLELVNHIINQINVLNQFSNNVMGNIVKYNSYDYTFYNHNSKPLFPKRFGKPDTRHNISLSYCCTYGFPSLDNYSLQFQNTVDNPNWPHMLLIYKTKPNSWYQNNQETLNLIVTSMSKNIQYRILRFSNTVQDNTQIVTNTINNNKGQFVPIGMPILNEKFEPTGETRFNIPNIFWGNSSVLKIQFSGDFNFTKCVQTDTMLYPPELKPYIINIDNIQRILYSKGKVNSSISSIYSKWDLQNQMQGYVTEYSEFNGVRFPAFFVSEDNQHQIRNFFDLRDLYQNLPQIHIELDGYLRNYTEEITNNLGQETINMTKFKIYQIEQLFYYTQFYIKAAGGYEIDSSNNTKLVENYIDCINEKGLGRNKPSRNVNIDKIFVRNGFIHSFQLYHGGQ